MVNARQSTKSDCVIIFFAAAPCSSCGVYVRENLHTHGDPIKIYCASHCPGCGTPVAPFGAIRQENQSVEEKTNA